MKLQVISVTPKAGIAKGTQKPYSMLIVDGIFTDDDGQMKTCEFAIFVEPGRPSPTIIVGKEYVPVVKTIVNRDKKLTAIIDTFLPYVEEKNLKAA